MKQKKALIETEFITFTKMIRFGRKEVSQIELDDKGRIKRKLSKNTGFEGRQGFGKGINEGFINLYSNIVCDIEDDRLVILALSVGHRREVYDN